MENPYFISPLDEYERLAEHLGGQQKRTIRNKKLLLDKLREHKGNIKRACIEVGIERKTFYNWRRNDEYFRQFLEVVVLYYDPDEHVPTIMDRIMQGDRRLIWRYLKKHHPNYKQKLRRDNAHVYTQNRDRRGRFMRGV